MDVPALLIAVATLITSFAGLIAAISALRASRGNRAELGIVRQDVTAVKENVVTIEKATNSMKDALVEATGVARELKGRQDMRAEQDAKTSELPVTITADQIVTDKIVTTEKPK